MRIADSLIDQIVASSQIPWGSRRREVVRELRSHVEDFVNDARRSGLDDNEIEKRVRANFGDPLQVSRNFAWVYKNDRTMVRLSVFGLVTLLAAGLSGAGTLLLQAILGASFGVPVLKTLASRHTVIEVLDILATTAVYVGIIS